MGCAASCEGWHSRRSAWSAPDSSPSYSAPPSPLTPSAPHVSTDRGGTSRSADTSSLDSAVLSPQALAMELSLLRQSTRLEVRRRFFLEQCRRWHPDKNRGDERRATAMFHVLQEKKEWFLAE